MSRRIVITLYTKEDIDLYLEYKSRVARSGSDVRNMTWSLIKKWLNRHLK